MRLELFAQECQQVRVLPASTIRAHCDIRLVIALAGRKCLTSHVYTCNVSHMKLLPLPCYCATLRQAARAATVLYEDMLADSGLHARQFTALQLIESAPHLTTTELAEGLGIDQTTATRTLALIKKAGFASDSVGQDRRQRHWSLTAQGQALMKKLKPRWDAAEAAFEKRLGRGEAMALKQGSHFAASRLHSV
jgi:DNA-binding MarR family transcriptional regulator